MRTAAGQKNEEEVKERNKVEGLILNHMAEERAGQCVQGQREMKSGGVLRSGPMGAGDNSHFLLTSV